MPAPHYNRVWLPGETKPRLVRYPDQNPPPPPPPPPPGNVDREVYEMYGAPLRSDSTTLGAHEGSTAGVIPSGYDFAKGAQRKVIGAYPTDGYTSTFHTADMVWTAHNAWTALQPIGGVIHTVSNVRVHYSQLEICHLNVATGVWTVKRAGESTMKKVNGVVPMQGGFFLYSPFNKVIDIVNGSGGPYYRKEPTGGWSVLLSRLIDNGSVAKDVNLLHTFWSDLMPRLLIGDGVTQHTHQVAIRLKARLFSDDRTVDVSAAQFQAHVCGDLYQGTNVGQFTDPSTGAKEPNPAFALPRYIKLTPNWQYLGHVTGTEAQIRSYPAIPWLTT